MTAKRALTAAPPAPPLAGPVSIAFVVRDARVRESETLAEFSAAPGSIVPTVDCSVVVGGLTWRVAHVRYFIEVPRIEVWLVPFDN
jgi:hypothetical protein